MDMQQIIYSFLWLFLILWLYKCIVRIDEGWHKNTKIFSRYGRTFSGVKGLIADKEGNLREGKIFWLFRYFRFIFYPFERVPWYTFRWAEAKRSGEIEDWQKKFIIWGDMLKSAIVSFLRIERTNRHKHQHSYRFAFKGFETGEKLGAAKDADNAQNISIDTDVSCLVIMANPAQAQFTDGGDAEWYTDLESSFQGILNEILRNTVFADLNAICGTNLANVPVTNIEPFASNTYQEIFIDADGRRRDTITFLERINYEILVLKKLGVQVKAPSILNFAVSEESKDFVTAVQKRAISEVNLQTAKK